MPAALGLNAGDTFTFAIEDGEVRIVAVPPDDIQFAVFVEWASDADTNGYAALSR